VLPQLGKFLDLTRGQTPLIVPPGGGRDCEKDSRRVLGLELISDPRNEGIASGVFPCIARGWNQGNGNEMCASTLPCRLREFLQVERVPIRVSIPSAIDVVRNMRVTDEPLVGNHLFFRPVAIQLLDEGE